MCCREMLVRDLFIPFAGGGGYGYHFVYALHCGECRTTFDVVALVVFIPDGAGIIGCLAGSDTGRCAAVWTIKHDDTPSHYGVELVVYFIHSVLILLSSQVF
ncbi:hypothetical protein EC11E007_21080 [Escherichia coli]|nr:hypothetical protein EC11E007_21080 [Escherichia coli]